jgi:hypothetical protein
MSRTLPPILRHHCGVLDTPIIGPGSGQHAARALCPQGHFLKWLPKAFIGGPQDTPPMDSINVLLVSGALDRVPQVRFREDGTCVCTGSLRLEEQGAQGTVFQTFVPFEAYGKVGEQLGTWHEDDIGTLQGKVFWRKYHTQGGEEKSGLALLVQKTWRLVPATAPVITDGSV